MAKLFVSYSRKDSVVARKLIQALKDIHQDVWVDWEDIPPAADWLEQIFRGIEGSDAFIFLISPDSIASEVCKVEIGRAAQNNKRIIPVVLRDVEPKNAVETIRELNWIFMREQDNFGEGVAKIKIAIELDLPWVEEHNRLQSRALEWHRRKDSSLLLRGRDLRNAERMVGTAAKKDPAPTFLQKTYIAHSRQDERRRRNLWIGTIAAIVVMAGLAVFAWVQRQNAVANEKEANANAITAILNEKEAVKNAELARKNEQAAKTAQEIAEAAQKEAERQEKIAAAQRSAARAQIHQFRPGELYTSTLLAIDSWQSIPSAETEEILRQNISLLPIPVEQMAQSGRINSLEISPDGETFLTASADGTACAWKVEDGTRLFCAAGSGSVNDAAFAPSGDTIVMGDEKGTVRIIDARDGKVQDDFEFEAAILEIDVRADGRLLAVTRDDRTITIIDLNARKIGYDLETSANINVTAMSPNGRYFAAGSGTGLITLWDLNQGGDPLTRPSHKDAILAIEFSPGSNFLGTGGRDKFAYVAAVATGDVVLPMPNEDAVESLAFNPNGSWIVTGSDDGRIRVWDTFSGRETMRMVQDGAVKKVAVSSNGQWIASTGNDRTVRLWNASTGTEIFEIPINGNGTALGFGKEDRYLLAGDEGGGINIWDISAMPAPESFLQFSGFAGGVQFSLLGDILAASDDNRVWLLDPEELPALTGRPEGEPSLTVRGNVTGLVLSPDSNWLSLSTELGSVILYDVEKNSGRKLIASGGKNALAFSPDSLQLITGDSEGNVQAWDVKTGSPSQTVIEGGTGVLSLASSPSLLAVGMKDRIGLLDWKDGKRMPDIELPGDHELLAFNADGSLLASANSSGQVHVWKYEDGGFILLYSLSKDSVHSIAFNPKNDQLVIGTAGNVYLVDGATGKESARIRHKDPVEGVSVSPDGNTLATASHRTIQFWDAAKMETIDPGGIVEAACSRMSANFDQAQWNALIEDEPYRLLCENLPAP